MEKKMSKGITALAIIEEIIGLLGSLLFIFMVFMYMSSLSDKSGNPENQIAIDVAKGSMYFLWPFLLIFFSGIGIYKLKLWAWLMNVYVIPLILLGVYFFGWARIFDIKRFIELWRNNWQLTLLMLGPIVIFIIAEAWFLTRPKVKEQFK